MSATGESTTALTTPCSPYDAKEYAIVAALSAATAFLSLVACCFVLFVMILFKKFQYFQQRLLLYLTIAALLDAIAIIVHRVDYNNETSAFYTRWCRFAGFFENNTSWMILLAVTIITVHIFVLAVFGKRTNRLEPLYVFIIFLSPFLVNWIGFIENAYGKAGAWCWIRGENEEDCSNFTYGVILRFVDWYIPLYITLPILIILYTIILVKVECKGRKWRGDYDPNTEPVIQQMRKEVRPLIWYPLIYFLLNIIPFINRIHNRVRPRDPALALWVLTALTYPLTGGLIAIAFTLDPGTMRRLRWANVKAAIKEYRHTKGVEEYPVEISTLKATSIDNDDDDKGSLDYGKLNKY